jgi:hypothetical protein
MTVLGVRYGVSQKEVIVPFDQPHQPYLIEVNCQQHNMDVIPIVMNCLGYSCLDVTMVLCLGNDTTWDVIPNCLVRYAATMTQQPHRLVRMAPVITITGKKLIHKKIYIIVQFRMQSYPIHYPLTTLHFQLYALTSTYFPESCTKIL